MQADFTNGIFRDNGAPAYFNSGEFHYFRVPHTDWKRRMRLLKEMGGNAIATYIPWLIHEPEEGRFRFDDDAVNLRKFLDTAVAEGLAVIARPGPYQYSELVYDGLPRWLCDNYPALLARDRHGRVMHHAAVSYLHPVFLDKVGKYFDRIAPILAEYSAARGGPVAMVQPDNELGGIHLWRGDFDCNPESMGFGCDNGRFARYLQCRFGDLDAVNRRYGSACRGFGEFGPPPEPGENSVAALLRQRDYSDFYWDAIGEYLETLMDMLTVRGVPGPFCHNSASPTMNGFFREAKARPGDRLLLGSDHYYNLNQRWSQNNPTPQYAIRCFLSLEELRLMGNPACVFEFPYGSLSDWPPIAPEDLEACLLMHWGFGMKGHNGYIFTGGANVPGTGSTSDIYDYNAPVDAEGNPRPAYEALRRTNAQLARHPEWITSDSDSDFRILMPWRLCRADGRWSGTPIPGTVGAVKSWEDFQFGFLTTAFAAGLTPELVDPESDGWVTRTDQPLAVWTDGTLAAAVQQRLVEFVGNGGSVLCLPVIPRYDEDFRSCSILADCLNGAASGEAIAPSAAQTRFNVAGVENIFGNGDYYPATAIPVGAVAVGEDENSKRTIAWRRGNFMFLGLSWCHAKVEHAAMLTALLEQLGMQRRIQSSDNWLFATLRRHGRGATLFVMNLGTSVRTATLRVRPEGKGEFGPAETMTVPAMTVVTRDFPQA